MHTEHHKWYSPAIGREMDIKIYGHAGKGILVFPAQGGRFFEFEDFKMIEAASWFINEGIVRFFTVDSVDNESWANETVHPSDRALRHNDYDSYILNEVVPFMRSITGYRKFFTTGCSMGGYHSGNFFFRHPDAFDGVISLSGLFSLNLFCGDFVDENIYFNSPLKFLPDLHDNWYLDQYRESHIIICCGQGAWEDEMKKDVSAMKDLLAFKNIPAWVDMWGYDVNHDWPWWRKQLPYFLGSLHQQSVI
ncbi:MAG: esterase family protein [Deltaproteobacteria bacterium]|nr:esterase family protein [Deltaproteobacteria bacterium]